MCYDTTKNILARFDVPVQEADGKTLKQMPLYQEPQESIWLCWKVVCQECDLLMRRDERQQVLFAIVDKERCEWRDYNKYVLGK